MPFSPVHPPTHEQQLRLRETMREAEKYIAKGLKRFEELTGITVRSVELVRWDPGSTVPPSSSAPSWALPPISSNRANPCAALPCEREEREREKFCHVTTQAFHERSTQRRSAVPPPESHLDWALRYVRLGWPVFPLGIKSKKPMIAAADGGKGCIDASLDEKARARLVGALAESEYRRRDGTSVLRVRCGPEGRLGEESLDFQSAARPACRTRSSR
jgi:hypothetical protein